MSSTPRVWLASALGAMLGLALFAGVTQMIRSVASARAPGVGAMEPILVVVNLLLGPVAVVLGGALGWRLGTGTHGEEIVEMSAVIGSVLVIGYGNTLRRDDGVGYLTAEAIAGWNRPGVSVRALHQLVPELAEMLADVDRVIFIDARPAHEGDVVEVQPVTPKSLDSASRSTLGHFGDPSVLLTLASDLYGGCPPAWVVTIPAVDFELGEDLSTTAQRGVADALRVVAELLDRPSPPSLDRGENG